MLKSISYAIVSAIVLSGSAFAGELGVTNSYGNSFRYGTGTTNIQFNTTSQLSENSTAAAIKLEKSTFNGASGLNNGFGNGDQDAPGNSGGNNNAENANSIRDLVGSFSDRAFAGSINYGTRNYTENTNANGTTNEQYTFGSTNFTHSVGTFSR